MQKQKILISWFYMYHGTSFFKHVLAAFSIGKPNINEAKIYRENISQEEMQKVFDNKESVDFVFDKIYLLYPSNEVYSMHTGKSYGFRKEALTETDENIKNDKKIVNIWQDIFKQEISIQEEYKYIEEQYPKEKEILYSHYWRNIQHYTPEEQIWWLMYKSNLPVEYKNRIEFINMNVKYKFTNLWDYRKIAEVTYKEVSKINKKHKNADFYINVSLATKEIQITWFSLAQGNLLPPNTVLFENYDVKSKEKNKRFKDFFIKSVPSNILDIIKTDISLFKTKPVGKKREIANYLFKSYIKQGFAITLIGERGVGKTNIIQSYNENKAVIVDCMAYGDSDILAEQKIFGYSKGAFKGATKLEDGYFQNAGGKIIVFDEISKLSRNIQSRLMQSLKTDENNYFSVRRMGEKRYEKIKCTVIFTTSNTINELKDNLLPELYDRIMQLVIELPSLRDTPEEIPPSFEQIWKQLKFNKKYNFKEIISSEMISWIKGLPLYGNYRDLQRIAIFYKSYLDFSEILKEYLNDKTPFAYTKNQYEKYISTNSIEKNKYFRTDKTTGFILNDFKKDLANWLINHHGSAKKAVIYLNKELNEQLTEKTIYTWKNKKL